MAFAAAAMMGMELMEVIGGGAAVAEAAADVAAAAEGLTMLAMEEATPLMETAVGRTATGEAVREFAAYSSAARAGSIARAMGASGLIAAGVSGAAAARSVEKAAKSLLGLGKRKRDGTGGTASLLPAHPTRPALPVMPRKKTKNSKKRVKRTISKRTQKKSLKRKDSKKSKSRKKGPSRTRVAAYQTHGLIQRDHVSYFGFQNHGGRDELFRSVADGILRTLFRKFRIQIRNPDEQPSITQSNYAVDKFKLVFRRRRFDTGNDPSDTNERTVDIRSGTLKYGELVQSLALDLRSEANDGRYPVEMKAFNTGTAQASTEIMRDLKFGDAIISLAVNTVIKLRNITPNDGNGTDRFALDTNPLEGVLYKFTGDAPVPHDSLYESLPTVLDAFMDGDTLRGIAFGPQRNATGEGHGGAPDAAEGIMGEDKLLSHPPKNGRSIWSNCRSSSKVALAPGAAVVHKMKFSYTGKLTKFLQMFSNESHSPLAIGTCHWLGLEQKFRQKLKAASGQHTQSEHDHVVVEYDIDRTSSAGCSFAAAAKSPRRVITDVINSAPIT